MAESVTGRVIAWLEKTLLLNTRMNRQYYIYWCILLFFLFPNSLLALAGISWSIVVVFGPPQSLFWLAVPLMLTVLAIALCFVCQSVRRGNDIGLWRSLVAVVMFAPALTLNFELTINRISRDFGLPAMIPHETTADVIVFSINILALLLLLYLFFKRGQKGPNKWGKNPLARHDGDAENPD